jgi:hypothetical protein
VPAARLDLKSGTGNHHYARDLRLRANGKRPLIAWMRQFVVILNATKLTPALSSSTSAGRVGIPDI